MMDTIKTILTNAYLTNCSFASFRTFQLALLKYGFPNNATHTVDELLYNLKLTSSKDSIEDKAYKYVLARDVEKVAQSNSYTYEIGENMLIKTRDKYVELLRNLNIETESIDFFVVEKFPKPFDNNDWSAFCPDSEDEQNYGIKKGIYFLEKNIRPYYSEILLAHEMIHAICGQKNPELFAMGLEEGLAEVLGGLYLSSQVLGINIVKNNFIYTRFNKNSNLLWSLYADHTRQAYFLYKKYGLESLIHLVSAGRKEIHNTEKKLIQNDNIDWKFSTKSFFEEKVDNMLDYLMLSYTPNYILSPLQMILTENAFTGERLIDISNKTEIPLNIVKRELENVAYQTSLFMLDNDKIGYSNIDLYNINKQDNHIPIIRYSKEV